MQGKDRGREASRVAHNSPEVGNEGGGYEASGVAENPRGSRHRVGGGVQSPQGANTPGVVEFPRVDKPRRDIASEGGPREGKRGQGGDKNPPTAQATGAQGADGGENERMGGPRAAEPLHPQQGTAADNGSAENLPRHTDGTDRAPQVRLTCASRDGS